MYIADSSNYRIRKVTISTGIITTFAGTGTFSYSGDNGPATSAAVSDPSDVALDSAGISYVNSLVILLKFLLFLLYLGNVYIADSNNHRIRKVTVSTGIITTFAGTGTQGYSGDNGPATSAALYWVTGIAVDSSGSHLLTTPLFPSVTQYSSLC